MVKTIKVAAIQLAAGADKTRNLQKALRLTRQAIRRGVKLVALPETFNFRGPEKMAKKSAETIPGPSTRPFMDLARARRAWILIGSLAERSPHPRKVYNTSVLIDPKGRVKARYRKIHLFNARLGRKSVRESRVLLAGRRPALVSLAGVKAGLSICYDLRFPGMYRRYAQKGARLLFVPSNFTYQTGQAHWEVLVRARAIENRCFVIAPNQCGTGSKKIRAYGHSLIIDPWGRVLARAGGNREETITARLDFRFQQKVRRILPDTVLE